MKTVALKQEVVDQFILEVSLINPIEKILKQLKNGEFRDCDIKWLDNKLESFIKFAGETLGVKIEPMAKIKSLVTLNDYAKNYYKTRFEILLDYFKNLIK